MEPLKGGSARLPKNAPRPAVSIELAMGVTIEALRLRRNMTLKHLASAAGIPEFALSDYEAGVCRAPASAVLAIANALDVAVGQLFRLHPASE